MKNAFASLVVGFIFALGLGLSGMTRPEKVVSFLDIFGNWDPSLLFVMVGAIAVHFVTYRLIRRRPSPVLTPDWHVPTKKNITPALVVGSFLFGVGWGLAGFCPGPALASLASLREGPVLFVVSMIFGMGAFKFVDARLKIEK